MLAVIQETTSENVAILVPVGAVKDKLSQLSRFARWIDSIGGHWYNPDLLAYRDSLLAAGLSPKSVVAHLSTIRTQYRALLRDNGLRDRLYAAAPPDAPLADRKAFVDELLTRITNATDPANAPVETVHHQDIADSQHIRLSVAQASTLINAPNVHTLLGLRDAAILALMLSTGIREAELCDLEVADLRQRFGGALALHIRSGKGHKARLVPYGQLDACLIYVETWLRHAGITDGIVFRGIRKGTASVATDRLTEKTIQNILAKYPLIIDGKVVKVCPHDLRRTYARRLYDAGLDLMAIQQNLGHANLKTTQGYIGTLDADKRQPPDIYSFNIQRLETLL